MTSNQIRNTNPSELRQYLVDHPPYDLEDGSRSVDNPIFKMFWMGFDGHKNTALTKFGKAAFTAGQDFKARTSLPGVRFDGVQPDYGASSRGYLFQWTIINGDSPAHMATISTATIRMHEVLTAIKKTERRFSR